MSLAGDLQVRIDRLRKQLVSIERATEARPERLRELARQALDKDTELGARQAETPSPSTGKAT